MKTAFNISPVDVSARQKIDIRAGDTVKVWQKIEEKGKTRLQMFEGVVLAVKHGKEAGSTFTVRRVASGVGVEKIFPLYSPLIDKIEIVKRSKVRRAKLYHIRRKAAKEIKRQMRNSQMVGESTADFENTEEEAPAEEGEAKETTATENLETMEAKEKAVENAPAEAEDKK